MAMRRTHHLVPNPQGGLDSKKGGGSRAIKHFDHKDEAIDFAQVISNNQGTGMVIHGRDGKIQKFDGHGSFPCPPKDQV